MAKLPEAIGKYQVLRELGRGGMGKVYEVRDPERPDRPLALKLILPHLAEGSALERFKREAELLGRISHPNVLRVVDLDRAPEGPFLVTDLIEGESLHRVAAQQKLTPRAAAAVVRDLSRAVEAIHKAGVLHRDLKPENVILRPDGTPVLLDFGLARADDVNRLTLTGVVMGTPNYMAPEQADGMSPSEMDGRVDIYGLGGILFTLLTAKLPVVDEDRMGVIRKVLTGDLDWPAGCDAGPEAGLWAVCRQAMATDRDQRFRTGGELAQALDDWLRGRRNQAAPSRGMPVGAIVLALAILAAGGGFAAWRLRGRGGPAPTAEPTCALTLLEPAADGETIDAQQHVRGRLQSNLELLKVRVADRPAERVLGAGGEFDVPVDLAPGTNRIPIEVQDPEGKVLARAERVMLRIEAPGWLQKVPPAERPPIPLPPGIAFGGPGEFGAPGEYRNEKDGSVLLWVPPGTFTMGSKEPPSASEYDSRPPHTVTLTRGFFIGKYEVTRAQWAEFRKQTKRPAPPIPAGTERHPVADVTAQESDAYCQWAGLRLPDEAEWEFAARGPDGRTFPWGEEDRDGYAATGALPSTQPVGSFPRGASPFGCLDMVGNVGEFVYLCAPPYGPDPVVDPRHDPRRFVTKSGGYSAVLPMMLWARPSIRWGGGDKRLDLGFRVARSGS